MTKFNKLLTILGIYSMDSADRKEVEVIIHDKMEGPLARIEAAIDIIQAKVVSMEDHMRTANGRTSKNEDKIEILKERVGELEGNLPHSVVNCPQNETLAEFKTFIENLKGEKSGVANLKDKLRKDREEKRANFLKVVTAISVVIAALALILNTVLAISNRSNVKHLQPTVEQTPPKKTN